MIKIKYNGSDAFHDVSFARDGNVITMYGITEESTAGFTTWKMDGVTRLGDFSDFTTVYRQLEDGIQYSDDGSVYVEPEPIPDPEPIEMQPDPTPSIEERINDIENAICEIYESLAE